MLLWLLQLGAMGACGGPTPWKPGVKDLPWDHPSCPVLGGGVGLWLH